MNYIETLGTGNFWSKYALFTKSFEEEKGQAKIDGNVGLAKKNCDKQNDNVICVEEEKFPNDYKIPATPKTYNPPQKIVSNEFILSNKLTSNKTYPSLIADSKKENLSINIGNSDKVLVVNNLKVKQGSIDFNGLGKLTIFVTGEFSISQGDFNQSGIDLDIYVVNQKEIKLDNKSYFNSNLYTNATKISITAAQQSHRGLIFAPHAHFHNTGGSLYGAVVAKSAHLSGQAEIIYDRSIAEQNPGQDNTNTSDGPTITKTPLREK